jgi:hypothetical protein
VDFFFQLIKFCSRAMALGWTQPLTEMGTWNLPGGKARPAHKVDNLTAICEPSVSRKCGRLDGSQCYGPLRPSSGIALLSAKMSRQFESNFVKTAI